MPPARPPHLWDETSDFLGSERREIVERIVSQIDALRSGGDGPAIVFLVGPSGVGKSRIVREVYRILQSRQPSPAYWPEIVEGLDSRQGPMANRKELGPEKEGFEWVPDAVPSFLWIDATCSTATTGKKTDVKPQLEQFLVTHGAAAICARDRQLGLYKSSRKVLEDVMARWARDAADEVLNTTLSELSGISAGLVLKAATTVFTNIQKRFNQRGLLKTLQVYTTNHDEHAVRLVGKVLSLSSSELPAVLVLEDAHDMGPDLRAIVATAARRRKEDGDAVLVICTAWDSSVDAEFRAWVEDCEAEHLAQQVEVRYEQLSEDDRFEILRRYARHTPRADAMAIVEAWKNPYALELLLTWEPVEDLIDQANEALLWDELISIEGLPDDVEGLYKARFRGLPEDTRRAVSACAASLAAPWQYDLPIRDTFVAQAAKDEKLRGPWEAAAFLSAIEGGVSAGWLMRSPETWLKFRERPVAEVALAFYRSSTGADADLLRARLLTHLCEWLEEKVLVGYSVSVQATETRRLEAQTALHWAFSLAETLRPSSLRPALVAARFLVAQDAAQSTGVDDALVRLHVDETLPHLDYGLDGADDILRLACQWLSADGQPLRAVGYASEALAHSRGGSGASWVASSLHQVLANAQAASGQLGEAIRTDRESVKALERSGDPGHLDARLSLCRHLLAAGLPQDAHDDLVSLLNRLRGDNYPEMLTVPAVVLGGQVAIELDNPLAGLDAFQDVLGLRPDLAPAIWQRFDREGVDLLAFWRAHVASQLDKGRTTQADAQDYLVYRLLSSRGREEDFVEIVDRCLPVISRREQGNPGDPMLQWFTYARDEALCKLGQIDVAIANAEALVARLDAALVPLADTKGARASLVNTLLEGERAEQALSVIKVMDSNETIRGSSMLVPGSGPFYRLHARALAAAGLPGDAGELLLNALGDKFGEPVWSDRHAAAWYLAEAGWIAEARELLEANYAEQVKQYGPRSASAQQGGRDLNFLSAYEEQH